MRRIGCIIGIAAGTLLCASVAEAAPVMRVNVAQRGDFAMIGNTLGYDCQDDSFFVDPSKTTVGDCTPRLTNGSPNVFWRADDDGNARADDSYGLTDARTTAVLELPANVKVTHAFLYWAGQASAPDLTARIDRPGTTFNQLVVASGTSTAQHPGTSGGGPIRFYQSVADITNIVKALGNGAYRVSDVETSDFRTFTGPVTFGAWSIVVFYADDSQRFRNLGLMDELAYVHAGTPKEYHLDLDHFYFPNTTTGPSLVHGKLGVIAYGSKPDNANDTLFVSGEEIKPLDIVIPGSAIHPAWNDIFNGSRSYLEQPYSTIGGIGDAPQLSGAKRSMGNVDLDVFNVSKHFKQGQTTAYVRADSTDTTNSFFIGAVVASLSSARPNFSSSIKLAFNDDDNGSAYLPGDTVRYEIDITNTGSDDAVGVVFEDHLPAGVTLIDDSIIVSGGGEEVSVTVDPDDDTGEYDDSPHSRLLTIRIGDGADTAEGGKIAVGDTYTIEFKVTIDPSTVGWIENQGIIKFRGEHNPSVEFQLTDGNGTLPESQPTLIVVDECSTSHDCESDERTICNTKMSPFFCVECFDGDTSMCTEDAPHCGITSFTCQACTQNSHCTGSDAPTCLPPGVCGKCTEPNHCSGDTPTCNIDDGVCVPCSNDDDCPADAPACQPSGSCGVCSATNSDKCDGPTPACDTDIGECRRCFVDGDCSGPTPACHSSGECVACSPSNHSACDGTNTPICNIVESSCRACVGDEAGDEECLMANPLLPVCQPSGACSQCSQENDALCVGSDTPACNPGPGICVDCPRDESGDCMPCETDLDCGELDSGVVCNGLICLYGCRGTEGSGCPDGEEPMCLSEDDSISVCWGCERDAECVSPTPACVDRMCVECSETDETECVGAFPVCSYELMVCQGCSGDAHCLEPEAPACQLSGANKGTCGECSSTNLALCEGDTPICDTNQGVCVGCGSHDDCDGATPACHSSGKCVECTSNNKTLCSADKPGCDPSENVCVGCMGDDDCSGSTPACQPSGSCGECSASNSSACGGNKPVCFVESGVCVDCSKDEAGQCTSCSTDSDCPSVGTICGGEYCVDGCRGIGGNGCPSGKPVCSSTTASAGQCVEEDPGTGGSGDDSGDEDVGVDSDDTDGDTLTGGGFKCSVPIGASTPMSSPIGLGAMVLGLCAGFLGIRRSRRGETQI